MPLRREHKLLSESYLGTVITVDSYKVVGFDSLIPTQPSSTTAWGG